MPLRDDRDSAVAELNRLYKRLKKQVDYLRAAPVYPSGSGTSGGGGSGSIIQEGITDHGELTGLLDDDHPQYFDNHIILISATPARIQKFPKTEVGLQQALAAASSGDVVFIPPGTITLTATEISDNVISIAGEELSWFVAASGSDPIDWEKTTFDDSAWSASVLFNHSSFSPLSGTEWVTEEDSDDFVENDVMLFRREFSLTTIPQNATLTVRADNYVDEVYLNDNLIFSGGAKDATYEVEITVSQLVVGTNLLSFKIRDAAGIPGENPICLSYDLEYTYGSVTVPSGVELVGLTKNSVIDGGITNNGKITHITITGVITGGEYFCFDSDGKLKTNKQIDSNVAEGTSPFDIISQTLVTNLNADKVDGQDISKINYSGTTAPTVNDDSDDGYSVGSFWYDTTNDKAYVCLDSAVGAAVWLEIGNMGDYDGDGDGLIDTAHGGTELDTSSESGIPHLSSGTWSILKRLTPGADTELTIATGEITVTQLYHRIDTEGDAISDDLDTINGLTNDGELLILHSENDTRDVVLKHGTGNIYIPGGSDITLDDSSYHVLLIYDAESTNWCVVGGGSGGGVSDAADLTYTPTILTDWDADADPGNVDDALDQLAERVDDNEIDILAKPDDASELPYTPSTLTDWDTDTDPGNVDDALDQLAKNVNSIAGGNISVLFSQTLNAVVENTIDETNLILVGKGSKIIPANTLRQGVAIRLTLAGFLSDNGAPTINIKAKLGTTEIASTGAQTLNNTVSNVDWHISFILTCRSSGASGSVVASGLFEHDNDAQFSLVKTSETIIDTTEDLEISITATWGTADVNNIITCQEAQIELLNCVNLAPIAPTELELIELV